MKRVKHFVRLSFFAAVFFYCLPLAAQAQSAPPPVILITLDTVRADHLGCYGDSQIHTPNIDQLAADGVRYDAAYAPVPITLPSHAALFTGLYPPATGIHDYATNRLSAAFPTLATVLRRQGYATAGVVAAAVLDSQFGLDQGFDAYFDDFTPAQSARAETGVVERPADAVVDQALAWLGDHQQRPFFLWVHLYDAHHPYRPPAPYDADYRSRPYDGEIAFTDSQLGRLFRFLRQKKLYDRALIVLTADHGESLGEHGESTHGFFVYNSTLHVPLVIKPPQNRPASVRVVSAPVSLVDIFPTVLQFTGGAAPQNLDGRNIFPRSAQDLPPDREIYSESLLPRIHFNWSELRSLRAGAAHYIEAPRPELYDLRSDPDESTNLYPGKPDLARGLSAKLNQLVEKLSASAAQNADQPAALDPALQQQLASLGYTAVSGGRDLATPGRDLPDPKDRIQLYEMAMGAMADSLKGLNAAANQKLKAALQVEPESVAVRHMLGLNYYRQGDFDSAAREFQQVLRLSPDYDEAAFYLGLSYGQKGDLDNAVSALRRATVLVESASGGENPRLAIYLSELAGFYQAQGRPDRAEPLYRRAIAINRKFLDENDPRLAADATNLAGILLARGNPAEATPLFRQALVIRQKSLGPDHPLVAESLNNLAAVYRAQRNWNAAELLLRQALTIREKVSGPNDPIVANSLNNIAGLYYAQGRLAEAEPLFRRALDIMEKSLGGNHPALATTLDNLAVLYATQGKYSDAEPLLRRSLAIRERTPAGHPADLATTLENYAEVLRNLNRAQEAAALDARAQALRRRQDP